MTLYQKLFDKRKIVIGMVHLAALPGSPAYDGDLEKVFAAAKKDLLNLEKGGADAVIIENFNDVPYPSSNEMMTYIAMTSLVTRLRPLTKLPVGINVQYNITEAEWDIAYACGCDFIRCEVFAETRVGPNGIFEPAGPSLMRLKARYPKDIAIFADVNVKHTFPLVDQPLDFTIDSLKESGVDAIISSGMTTGSPPTLEEAQLVKKYAGDTPVIIGSGVNVKNVKDFFGVIDGAIIGSSLKKDGNVLNEIDINRVRKMMKAVR